MKNKLMLIAMLCAAPVMAGDLFVDLDITSAVVVIDPLAGPPVPDDTGFYSTQEQGVAAGTVGNGKPRKAQFVRYYEASAIPEPNAIDCTGQTPVGNFLVGRQVLLHEMTLVFDNLSSISARQNGGYICLDVTVTPGAPSVVNDVWFSAPLIIDGGTGNYEGASGDLDYRVDFVGEGDVNLAVPGLYVGTSHLGGFITIP